MSPLIKSAMIKSAEFKMLGGIHPQQYKSISNQQPIKYLAEANQIILPLPTSDSLENNTQLFVGQAIKKNQILVDSDFTSHTPSTHAGISGTLTAIALMDLGHVSGLPVPALEITQSLNISPSESVAAMADQPMDWQKLSREELIHRVHHAGIVGLGGAAFPTHVKLNTPLGVIDTLIINAMECEPYITCDDRMLQELADSVLLGALMTAKIVGASRILFGIEDNKPDAISALNQSLEKYLLQSDSNSSIEKIEIVVTQTKYPSGGEKQIIQLLTGQQVPQGKLPASLGLLVQNVATVYAIQDAVLNNQVMTHRLVTITGDLVSQPGNYWIAFGTPVSHIINSLEIDATKLSEFIFGGPLMGQHLSNINVPTKKSTNCIIFNSQTSSPETHVEHQECIRCGECEVVCPIALVPQQLYWFAKTEQWDELDKQNLNDCIECGACSYVCPSKIPLVDYYQFAKSDIKQQKTKQQKSEIAKLRFENRENRLLRIKAERDEKRRLAAEARKNAAENSQLDPEGKKSAIAAALQRVQNKKDNKLE